MLKYLNVGRSELLLDGAVIGYRYYISFGKMHQGIWDMEKLVSDNLLSSLKTKGVTVQNKQPVSGFLDGDVFKTRMEHGVTEVDSVGYLKWLLKVLYSRHEDYALLRSSYPEWVRILMRELKSQGVFEWEDSRYSEDNLTWECRFIGGFGAWSGGGEDICDADTLSRSVSSKIDRAVKSVRKSIGKKFNLGWCTGEKAWCYFKFDLCSG